MPVIRAMILGLILLAVSLWLVGTISQPSISARAEQEASDPALVRARVRFEVLRTSRESATGGPTAEARVTSAVGNAGRLYLAAGGVDDADICHVGIINDPSSVRAVYLWQLDVQVVAASATQTTLDLRWSRTRGTLGDGQVEAGDTRTLTLGAGEYHVFDYVSAPPGVSSCANLLLRVLADPLPPPDLQPPVTVDLWLSQEGKTGRQWTYQRLDGQAGQALPFRLGGLRWSPSGAILRGPADGPALSLEVSGTIHPTLRPDRFVDLTVRARRTFSWARARVDGEGQQALRCALGEAVAILLPDPRGQARVQGAPDLTPPFAEGIFVQGDSTVVDFARFFAGSHGALYVVVRRQS